MGLCSSNLCSLRGNCVCNTVCLSSAPLMNVLGCITLLVVVNGAGMNIHVQVSVGVPTGNSFGFRPRSSIWV